MPEEQIGSMGFFEWDYSKYVGTEAPFVVRHADGSAQVVADWFEGRPMRVPGFLIPPDVAYDMDDAEILRAGLEMLGDMNIEISRLGQEHKTGNGYKVEESGDIVPADWVKFTIDAPPKVTTDNKFNISDGYWETFTEAGKFMFNFLYEFLDRNSDEVFATDLFKLDGFTNQQIVIVQKILQAAKHNISIVVADFVSTGQDYYDEDGNFNPITS